MTQAEVIMKDFMSIRIRHRDKNRTTAQQADMSVVITDEILFFTGVLYGTRNGVWVVIRININIVR